MHICVERVEEALGGKGFTIYRMKDVDEALFAQFSEKGLLDRKCWKTPAVALLARSDGQVSILCNAEDQVLIRVEVKEDDIQAATKTAKDLSRLIGSQYPFAKDERIGWLTARPLHAGTGLQVCYKLHLPMLAMLQQTRTIAAALHKEHRLALSALPEHDVKNPAALFILFNLFTAYDSTKNLVEVVRELALSLSAKETNLREKILKRTLRSTYLDQVYRAYGILRYARRLSEAEFMEYWSKLRLGAAAGLLPLSLEKVDSLLQKAGKASLLMAKDAPRDDHTIHFARADVVRAELNGGL
jgi:protein arginine kinase